MEQLGFKTERWTDHCHTHHWFLLLDGVMAAATASALVLTVKSQKFRNVKTSNEVVHKWNMTENKC